MSKKISPPEPTHFIERVDELRDALSGEDPEQLAARTGAGCLQSEDGKTVFRLEMLGSPVELYYPEFVARYPETGREAPLIVQAMLAYYFTTADGTPLAGDWVSFADLPDGRFYNQAFQGYTGQQLVRAFGDDRSAWVQAAQAAGGEPQPLGDASFIFQGLPRLPLLVVYWQGDEDFPSSFQVLFDASAHHYLPTDVCAIFGSMFTRKLLKHHPAQP